MPAQVIEPLERLAHARNLTGGYPPQNLVRLGGLLEPLATPRHHGGVGRAIDEIKQRLDRRPHRHVHQKTRIFGDLDIGGVTAVGLQSPDEARRRFRAGVDLIQRGHEFGQLWTVRRREDAADVELGDVPSTHVLPRCGCVSLCENNTDCAGGHRSRSL